MAMVVDYLRELWRDVLRLDEPPSTESNFLSIGGDSMLMIRMLVAVSAKYEREFEFSRFFGEPTIATLSTLIVEACSDARSDA